MHRVSIGIKSIIITMILVLPAPICYNKPTDENPPANTRPVCDEYIETAEIKSCTGDISGLGCTEMLSFNLAVNHFTDELTRKVCVEKATRDGEIKNLDEVVEINITRTDPKISYPLTYYHTVPYNPHEDVIKVQNILTGVQKCDDSPSSQSPSCGWQFFGESQIPDSQGFCCNKSLDILNGANDPWRGEEVLEEQSTLLNSFSTAHCLRYDEDLLFNGYQVASPAKYFQVNIEVTMGSNTSSFLLDSATPDYTTPAGDASINLAGHLAGTYSDFNTPPAIEGLILYAPDSPSSHLFVQNLNENLLLVPANEVTTDGSQCDKVGVSYNRFRQQGSLCDSSLAGDCLHNQLYHKHQTDLQLLATDENSDTTYLVRGMKVFKGSVTLNTGTTSLEYRVESITSSSVNLEIDAAGISISGK